MSLLCWDTKVLLLTYKTCIKIKRLHTEEGSDISGVIYSMLKESDFSMLMKFALVNILD